MFSYVSYEASQTENIQGMVGLSLDYEKQNRNNYLQIRIRIRPLVDPVDSFSWKLASLIRRVLLVASFIGCNRILRQHAWRARQWQNCFMGDLECVWAFDTVEHPRLLSAALFRMNDRSRRFELFAIQVIQRNNGRGFGLDWRLRWNQFRFQTCPFVSFHMIFTSTQHSICGKMQRVSNVLFWLFLTNLWGGSMKTWGLRGTRGELTPPPTNLLRQIEHCLNAYLCQSVTPTHWQVME